MIEAFNYIVQQKARDLQPSPLQQVPRHIAPVFLLHKENSQLSHVFIPHIHIFDMYKYSYFDFEIPYTNLKSYVGVILPKGC